MCRACFRREVPFCAAFNVPTFVSLSYKFELCDMAEHVG